LASVQLNQLQPSKSSDQSRTMAWHWIGSVPIIYIFITCSGYAGLLYISYANCHLRVFNFPKISHLGAKQPELQFFAFLCICQAICFGLMVHYSYQVWKLMLKNSKLARFTQITGMISTAGLVLIGCFQVDEAADIHFSGAVMCFILGGVYYILTTVITRYLREKDAYFNQIYRYRCIFTGFIILLMIIMIFTMSVKQYIFNYDPHTETTELFGECKINITYIKMSDHYYAWELYSSLTEWVSCIIYMLYLYSYRHELKMIGASSTQIQIKEDFELARIVAQTRKYERNSAGWAAVNQLSGDDQAESGSLLENDCFDDSSSTMRTALS